MKINVFKFNKFDNSYKNVCKLWNIYIEILTCVIVCVCVFGTIDKESFTIYMSFTNLWCDTINSAEYYV